MEHLPFDPERKMSSYKTIPKYTEVQDAIQIILQETFPRELKANNENFSFEPMMYPQRNFAV